MTKLEMRGKARCLYLVQTHMHNSGLLDHTFTKFSPDVEGSLVVSTCTSVLQSSNPLWNASTQNEGGVCQKSVTIGTSIDDGENKVGLIIPTHMCIYTENLVKIGPVHSEIIGLHRHR